MATKTLSPPSLPRGDDDVDPSPSAVLLREFESLREEMRSRVEALLTGQRTQAAAELRSASSSADLLALSGVLREPVRSEIVFRPFWRSAPGVWFATLEEKFAARGIIDENEMYLNTIGNLDEDIIRDISVAVGALPVRERYTRLKQILLNKFSLSDSDKLRSLFGAVSMGSRSPSEYMEFLIANGAKSLDKDINPGNEESMIKKADEIYASLRRDEHCNTSYGLNAIDSRRTREENSRIEILERKLDQVLDSIEQRKRDRGTSYNNRNNNGNRGKWRSSRSDRDSNGGSGFCRLHSKYGKDAHRCSSTPCAWKEPNDDANGRKLETLSPDNSVRLHIRDRESGRVYMIDSGAEISVIPRPIDWKASSVNFGVKAANQLPIRVFGTENLIVNLDEDFIFPWTFVVADVPYPIIGGDILSRFHLLPDLTCKCLLDAANNRVGDCYISQYADDEPLVAGISLDLGSDPFAHIFKRYPDVIGLIPPKPIIDSEVFHYIETDGKPIAQRAHRLSPPKLLAAKEEFSRLIKSGMVTTSKSPWASPIHLQSDTELTKILSDADISLKLASFPFGPQKIELYGERRGERIRPFLPASLRDEVFDVLHASAHPSARAMKSLIKARYVWPDMDRDITRRCSACIRCQAAKVGRHTKPTPLHFDAPSSRFHHVHIDIVGPLPVCRGYRYLLTMIDRFTRWPEAVPLRDITAETVAREFHNCWIARFGSPRIITSDQGSQFESRLFRELLAVLGIKRCRTTSFHPSANGLIERWHRTLKAALMCHAHPENWLELLPSVLLGLRTRLVGEFDVSPAEMLYGTTLAIPGDLCFNTDARVDPKIFASKFRAHMNEVRPVPVKHKSKITPFVAKELPFCTHVFKLVKKSKPPLQPPYTGPHKIINRDAAHNTYTIDFYGREQVVSVDKLKPAHLLPETASPGIGREKFVPAILRRNRVVKGV
ncbi:hypothetical protein TKK_0015807 [Trichogramma kaykai]